MIAVDTNVLVYSVDKREPARRATARQLITTLAAAGETRLLWQVAVEFVAVLRQWEGRTWIGPSSVKEGLQKVRRLFPLVVPSEQVFDISFQLYRRYSLSHGNSLLLAACIDAKIDTLYTEDLTHGVTYDGVKAINPFVNV
jgi:predicted nucleic acid-binding protein